MKYSIDIDGNNVSLKNKDGEDMPLESAEAFEVFKSLWLRAGWDTKYVYSFAWMGRPIIQLPDDMVRMQEVIYALKPTLIIETGIAHGGSLIFYASLLKMINNGRVVGIDIEIREHNRRAIEEHELFPSIHLIEGSSTEQKIIESVRQTIKPEDKVLVILDSNHSRDHVLQELELYGEFVSPGSYIVATDGIMQEVAGAPRTAEDWSWNNPQEAVRLFLDKNKNFVLDTPKPVFNESFVNSSPTYWPNSWLKRAASV